MAPRLIQTSACILRGRAWARAVGALLLTLAVASCAFDPPSLQRTPREATAEPTAKSRVAARRGTPAKGAETALPDGNGIAVPGEEVAALEVDLTNFRERLIGLDSDEIGDLMGTPSLERSEPPALIWQYRGAACTVDLFMFDDGSGSTVDHVEVRGAQGDAVDEKACFTGLLRNTKALKKPATGASAGVTAAPASPARPVSRGGVAPARTTPQAAPTAPLRSTRSATPPASAAPPAAPKAPPSDFDDDDEGAPPAGAAAKAPAAAAPAGAKPPAAAAPKVEFEIEGDPDKLGPVRNEDDPAGRNEDLVE